jgi:hypothetical protein
MHILNFEEGRLVVVRLVIGFGDEGRGGGVRRAAGVTRC